MDYFIKNKNNNNNNNNKKIIIIIIIKTKKSHPVSLGISGLLIFCDVAISHN